jgi:hypothetical protein
MRGYIYLLITPERPSIVKIGKTTKHPRQRCNRHNRDWYLSINTWEVAHWQWVENCHRAEVDVHRMLDRHNLGAKFHREAFRINIDVAKDIVGRVCERYPPKSDNKPSPVMRRKKALDEAVYQHIRRQGDFSELIFRNQSLLDEEQFYEWVAIIEEYL